MAKLATAAPADRRVAERLRRQRRRLGAFVQPADECGPVPVPVLDQDFPDPDVLVVDGTYYAYATEPADGSVNVQMATSTDLRAGRCRSRTRCRSCRRGRRTGAPGRRR